MDAILTQEKEFAFAAVGSMCLVAMASGKMSENEVEEIYIQIHQSERMNNESDFALEALDDIQSKLTINYDNTQENLLTSIAAIPFDHDQAVEIINMSLDVIKSNKEIPTEKIDVLSGLCKVLNIYSDEFNFIT